MGHFQETVLCFGLGALEPSAIPGGHDLGLDHATAQRAGEVFLPLAAEP